MFEEKSKFVVPATLDRKSKDLQDLEVNGKVYKYGLLLSNEPINFKNGEGLITQEEEKEANTVTENLLDMLECDKDTAFESFIVKHH